MAVYDAQLNNTARATTQYTDLDLFFGKKSSDNDIRKVTDAQSVKRSIRNLVQLNTYEKPFHPEISGGVRELLFEHLNPMIAAVLTRKIEDVINNFEPRCRLVSVRAIPNFDRNAYEISIEFYVVNAPTELVELDVLLERIR